MPKWDDIQGEEVSAPKGPRWEDIEGEEITADGTPKMGEWKARALGFANKGTMSYVDELGGTLATYLPKPDTTAGRALDAAGNFLGVGPLSGVRESSVRLGPAAMPSESDTDEVFQAKADLIKGVASAPTAYELVRDKIRAERQKAKRDRPGDYMAGEIAGGVGASVVGNILLPGGGAVVRGALEGGIDALGDSEADLGKGEYLRAAADTALGAGIGAGAGYLGDKVGGYIGRKFGAAPEALEGMAQGRAVKAATGQNKREISKMIRAGELGLDTGTVERVGADLLDEGVVSASAGAKDILQRAAERKEAWGATIGETLDYLDNLGASVNVPALADDMERSLIQPLARGSYGDRQIAARLAGELDALRDQGDDVALSALEGFKRRLDRSINYSKAEMPAASEALLRMRSMLNEAIENSADDTARAAGAPEVAELFREAKAVYSSMAIGERVAQNQVTSQASNRFVAPSDYGVGAVAAVAANANPAAAAVQGAAWALGHRAIRTRGNQVAASALRGLSGNSLLRKVAEVAPDMLGKYAGPVSAAIARGAQVDDSALAAMDYVLQQVDPEWRALKESLAKEAQ
jgi:hypothetical protein